MNMSRFLKQKPLPSKVEDIDKELQKGVLDDGIKITWYNKNQKRSEEHPDGTKYYFHPSGMLRYEELPDGTKREWGFPGERKEFILPNGETKICDTLHYYLKYEKLPDGTERGYYDSKDNDLKYEKFPNGREVTWSLNYTSYRIPGLDKLPDGMYKVRKSSDGIKMIYNEKNEVIYHFTNDVEDTDAWLAKERIKAKKEKNMLKFEGKPKIIREVANKIASSKAFNDIALKLALQKVKKSRR